MQATESIIIGGYHMTNSANLAFLLGRVGHLEILQPCEVGNQGDVFQAVLPLPQGQGFQLAQRAHQGQEAEAAVLIHVSIIAICRGHPRKYKA